MKEKYFNGRIIICLLISFTKLSMVASFAQSVSFDWAYSSGNFPAEYCVVIDYDSDGNLYTTGGYSYFVDFNPGPDSAVLTSAGMEDIFLCKTDENSNFIWAKSIGGWSQESSRNMIVDNSENIYLTGNYINTFDFDPSAGVTMVTGNGFQNLFLAKFDSSGNFLWVKTTENSTTESLFTDIDGNIFMHGFFSGTVDFDFGPGVHNLIGGQNNFFISKYTSAGDLIWVHNIGSYSNCYAYTNTSGITITGGGFSSTIDFDPGPGVSNMTSLGSQDIFLSKFDSAGNYVWSIQAGSTGTDFCQTLTIDNFGNCIMKGKFQDTVDFDPGPAALQLVANSTYNTVIWKLDASGTVLWAGRMENLWPRALMTDNIGNIYCTGTFNAPIDFDPGPGINIHTSVGIQDIYLFKLLPNGNFEWVNVIGDDVSFFAFVNALKLVNNNIYIAGQFIGLSDFDPGPGIFVLENPWASYSDIFVVKLHENSTGFTEPDDHKNALVFPNPAADFVIVNLPMIYENNLVRITSITGEVFISRTFTMTDKAIIDISAISNGIYFVSVKNQSFFEIQKMSVIK